MLTEKQIEDQQEFERKQISGGIERLRSRTRDLEGKDLCFRYCLWLSIDNCYLAYNN